MRIMLTGQRGQVGYELRRSLATLGEVIATDRTQLDLAQPEVIVDKVLKYKPDIIVNAAAYTAVDKAEQEAEQAIKVNTDAPEQLAKAAKQLDIPLIHYSTDYVFNGNQSTSWKEEDVTDPQNVYGKSKLAGEQAIMAVGCRYLIFRTSWVYGARGHNFLRTMCSLAEREVLSVVDDQIGAPTWSRHIADVTAQIIAQSRCDPSFWLQHNGIYHLTAAGQTSWHGFASAIFDHLAETGNKVPEVQAIPTTQYPTPAVRPLFSCLNNQKLQQHFQLVLPDWRHSLELVMDEVLANKS